MTTSPADLEPDYPAAKKYLGGVAEGYLQRRENHPTWIWEQSQVQSFVEKHPAGLTVLDVPLGTGRYVPLYVQAGWKVLGCDISKDMVAEAERTLGPDVVRQAEFRVSPAEHLPWPDRSIDVIVSSRFIQWLPELHHVDKVIAEFGRVGKSELFLQLRIPAEVKVRPAVPGPVAYLKSIVREMRRQRRTAKTMGAKITSHPEPELLAILERHGWALDEIGVECPTSHGLRFYRFSKR
jgi:ubiquinone/menaquinone biosynthesis C-methylase UbiE